MNEDIGHEARARALAMGENELRQRVDLLLEQCAREEAGRPLTPRHGMLYASEIKYLLGVGPLPGAEALAGLSRMIEQDGQGS